MNAAEPKKRGRKPKAPVLVSPAPDVPVVGENQAITINSEVAFEVFFLWAEDFKALKLLRELDAAALSTVDLATSNRDAFMKYLKAVQTRHAEFHEKADLDAKANAEFEAASAKAPTTLLDLVPPKPEDDDEL